MLTVMIGTCVYGILVIDGTYAPNFTVNGKDPTLPVCILCSFSAETLPLLALCTGKIIPHH